MADVDKATTPARKSPSVLGQKTPTQRSRPDVVKDKLKLIDPDSDHRPQANVEANGVRKYNGSQPHLKAVPAPEKNSSVEKRQPAEKSSLVEKRKPIETRQLVEKHEPIAETLEKEKTVIIERDYAGFPEIPFRLTNSTHRMKNTIRQTLRYYHGRPEVANERSNWGMMHSMMVYGIDTKVLVGRKSYSTIAWIAGNNACRGERILDIDPNGDVYAKSGVGLQGHQAQLLAVLSLCDVPIDYTLYAGKNKYTVRDLVQSEMRACKSGEELTFTLIGLAHYLDTETVWKNAEGETWDFRRLIREELSQPIVGAACGGTHRLMGYAHALRKRRSEGRPITGQWQRAEIYTYDFIKYVYRLQNRDGSMSTDWFEGREDNGDLDRKIQTTGHMVEWLLTITPDSQLQSGRLVSAVRFLANSMYQERGKEWKIGPKGHALRSLAMFYERAYKSGPAWQNSSVARSHRNSVR